MELTHLAECDLVVVDLTRGLLDLENLPQTDPSVGIWWASEHKIAALVQSADKAHRGSVFLDSELAHIRDWPKVAAVFGFRAENNCYDVPRGRVLLTSNDYTGQIYHGNATDSIALQMLASIYGLRTWRAGIDEHYLFGDEAEALLDAEFGETDD